MSLAEPITLVEVWKATSQLSTDKCLRIDALIASACTKLLSATNQKSYVKCVRYYIIGPSLLHYHARSFITFAVKID